MRKKILLIPLALLLAMSSVAIGHSVPVVDPVVAGPVADPLRVPLKERNPGPAEINVERAEGQLKVGFGSHTIAPADEFPEYKFVTPIDAKATVFQIGDLRVAWVSLDVIGVFRLRMDVIKERIAEKTGIPTSHIMVKATHNHMFRGVAEDVLELAAEGAAIAVQKAVENLFEARIGMGYRSLRKCISVNRDIHGGFLDTNLYVMRIDDMRGIARGAIFNFPAHPDVFRWFLALYGVPGIIGGDWPAYARESVEARIRAERRYWPHGKLPPRQIHWRDAPAQPVEFFTMFTQGGGGSYVGLGAAQLTWEHKDGIPVPWEISLTEEVARNTVELLHEIKTSNITTIEFRRMKMPRPPMQEWLVTHLRVHELDLFAEDIILQAFIFNDEALWSTWPAEMVCVWLEKFRERGGFKYNIVLEHANEHWGYPRPEGQVIEGPHWGALGGRAFLVPDGGRRIFNAVLGLANPDFQPIPPFDRATMGTIRGNVTYDGAQRIEVTFQTYPRGIRPHPGARVVTVGPGGTFEFTDLVPGVKYLSFIEVAVAKPEDLPALRGWPAKERVLITNYPVLVTSGQTTVVHFRLKQKMLETGVKALDIEEIRVRGNEIFGRIRLKGKLHPWERRIQALLFPFGVPQRRGRLILNEPVQQVAVGKDGRFRFDGLTPGDYRVVLWLDINSNLHRDIWVDMFSPISNVLTVPPRRGVR